MAYYDALIAAWNNPTQPPPGVTGTGLNAGMTTQQKVTTINGWKTTGTATPMVVPTYQIYNLIDLAEFNALTDPNKQAVRDILSMGTVDSSPGTKVRSRFVQIFPSGTVSFQTLSNFAKTFDAPDVDWCFRQGYPTLGANGPGNLSTSDASNAGLV
jgi:hypothetical protein